MKRILTFILTLTLALSFCVNSFAAATTATASETQTGTSEAQTDTSKTQADTSEAQTDTSKVQAGASYGISNLSGAPDIVAESAVVMDANTGTILYGKEPTVKDIADELEVDVMDVIEAIDASYYPTSLSEPIYEKDGSTISMEERIEDKRHAMWFEKIALSMEIDKLDEKERLILYLRYQLDFNQEKVAQRLHISQVQVSRLEKKIITKLRKHLNESH